MDDIAGRGEKRRASGDGYERGAAEVTRSWTVLSSHSIGNS